MSRHSTSVSDLEIGFENDARKKVQTVLHSMFHIGTGDCGVENARRFDVHDTMKEIIKKFYSFKHLTLSGMLFYNN